MQWFTNVQEDDKWDCTSFGYVGVIVGSESQNVTMTFKGTQVTQQMDNTVETWGCAAHSLQLINSFLWLFVHNGGTHTIVLQEMQVTGG